MGERFRSGFNGVGIYIWYFFLERGFTGCVRQRLRSANLLAFGKDAVPLGLISRAASQNAEEEGALLELFTAAQCR